MSDTLMMDAPVNRGGDSQEVTALRARVAQLERELSALTEQHREALASRSRLREEVEGLREAREIALRAGIAYGKLDELCDTLLRALCIERGIELAEEEP